MRKATIIIILLLSTLFAARFLANVNAFECTGCGDCVRICPVGAVELVHGKAIIDTQKCVGCKLCATHCTQNAIKMLEPITDTQN